MKKRFITLFIMCFALMALLCGCGSNSTDDTQSQFVGNWTATSFEMEGLTLGAEDLGECTLNIEENGKLTLVFDGEEGEGNWVENEDGTATLSAEGEEIKMVLEDNDQLSMDLYGIQFIFERNE